MAHALCIYSWIFAFREGFCEPRHREKRRMTASLLLYISKYFKAIHMSLVLSGCLDKCPGALNFRSEGGNTYHSGISRHYMVCVT